MTLYRSVPPCCEGGCEATAAACLSSGVKSVGPDRVTEERVCLNTGLHTKIQLHMVTKPLDGKGGTGFRGTSLSAEF